MLATGIREYLFVWQLPILALLVVGWPVLGGYFLAQGIIKNGGKRKTHLGECIIAVSIISVISAIVALIVYRAGMKLSAYPVSVIGMIGAVVVYVGLFILMVHTWQKKLSFAQTARASLMPLVATLLLGAVLLGPTAVVSWNIRQKQLDMIRKVQATQRAMIDIWGALFKYGADRPPKNLDVLIKANLLKPEQLKSPYAQEREVGFIYAPAEVGQTHIEERGQNIVVADYGDTFGAFRVVLFANGEASKITEMSFRELVSRPVNRNFREALKKAEGLIIEEKQPGEAEYVGY